MTRIKIASYMAPSSNCQLFRDTLFPKIARVLSKNSVYYQANWGTKQGFMYITIDIDKEEAKYVGILDSIRNIVMNDSARGRALSMMVEGSEEMPEFYTDGVKRDAMQESEYKWVRPYVEYWPRFENNNRNRKKRIGEKKNEG